MDLEQVLNRLASLIERESEGEDVAAEKAELEAERKRLERDGRTMSESELESLKREKREREEEEMARAIVSKALRQKESEEAARQERIEAIVQKSLSRYLNDGGADDLVRRAVTEIRQPSRFATASADPEYVAELAANGGEVDQKRYANAKGATGAHREAEQIKESKSIAHFMSIVARHKSGRILTEGEKIFLNETQQKALAEGTDSAGGFLIHPEWMPDILNLLRARAVVRSAGPRIVPFSKLMNQTVISTGSSAFYTAENARMATSDMTFNDAPLLTPHNLTALVPVSNYLLNDAAAAESIVRDDMTEVMALREDLAFLQGTGGGGEPIGMKAMSGVTLNPLSLGTDGDYLNLVRFRQIRNVTRTFNASAAKWAYFFNPAVVSHLETLTDSFGRFLADTALLSYNESSNSGTLDGVPFYTSNQIPINLTTGANNDTSYIILVNMAELIVGASQTLTLDVSSEASYTTDGGTTWVSTFQNNQTLFRAVMRHDINHRRTNQVIVQTGVRVP